MPAHNWKRQSKAIFSNPGLATAPLLSALELLLF